MSEKKVVLFGNNVMLELRPNKEVGLLHLPDDVSSNNSQLFDIVVIGVGEEVTQVKVGDIVMANMSPHFVCTNPATGKSCIVIQEGMVQGVLVDG